MTSQPVKHHSHTLIVVSVILTVFLLTPQIPSVLATSKSPYQSGYDHGCSDARISELSDRYIKQPGKGPKYHTDEFMRGYNTGYNACSSASLPPSGPTGGNDRGTFLEGQGDGKDEGYRDAINGRPFDDRCPSGKNNEYCIAYKLAYDWEYWVTKGLPRK